MVSGDLTQEPPWNAGGSTGCCCDYYKGILVSVFMTGALVSTMAGKPTHSLAKQTKSATSPRCSEELVIKSC